MSSRIYRVASYLPSPTLSNKQLESEFPGWNADKIKSKVGIESRHIVQSGETALDLGYRAAEKVLDGYDRSQIDFLLLCTQSPEYFLPTGACILQDRLGLSTAIGAFDFNLGCSGFVYGLSIAKGLIASGTATSILLVTAETYSRYIHPEDRGNRSIFGDGAAACIIEKSDRECIGTFSLGTDGRGAGNLIVKNGASAYPYDSDAQKKEGQAGSFFTENNLYMDGTEIFNFTIEAVPSLTTRVLLENKISIDEVDYIIFHQANLFMLNYLRRKCKFDKNKFYMNMETTGNTVSSTIPIAMIDAQERGLIARGDKILLVGFGVGYSYGAVVIEF